MKPIWLGLLFIGGALFLIATLGQIGIGASYHNYPARKWEAFDHFLVERTPNIDSLYNVAQQQISLLDNFSPKDVMQILYDLVKKRFTHGDKAKHTLFSNWLLYSLGKIHPAFAHILDPDLMLRQGYSVLCGQASYILLRMALKAGIPARHVGLQGHVVVEAWYENEWHMYDPDLEVIALDEYGNVMAVDTLARNSTLIRKLYEGRGDIEEIVSILQHREKHNFITYPQGARFVWKVEVIYLFKIIAEYLKFIIPLFIVSIALLQFTKKDNLSWFRE